MSPAISVTHGFTTTTPELVEAINKINFKRSPGFLGGFDFAMFPRRGGMDENNFESLSCARIIRNEIIRLSSLVPGQRFNCAFIQRYYPGQEVKRHKDPHNNVKYTVIGLYGQDWETTLHTDEAEFHQVPGDAWVLPCTFNNERGPAHWVTWDNKECQGIRYAVILNTIEWR